METPEDPRNAEAAAIEARLASAKENPAELELLQRQYGERLAHLKPSAGAPEPASVAPSAPTPPPSPAKPGKPPAA